MYSTGMICGLCYVPLLPTNPQEDGSTKLFLKGLESKPRGLGFRA